MTAVEVEAPSCPSWCPDAAHGWRVDRFAVVKRCRAASVVAADEDGQPVTVTLEQFASHDGRDGLEVDPPTVTVDVPGRLSADAALALAAALKAAVDEVEPGKRCACGKAAAHLFADPDSAEWACRVPDGAR